MLFLLLGNLFSWSALKQQQTVVNTPACIKFALLVHSPCLAEVPLLCHPLWETVRDSQDGLQAARIRRALPETPSCAILRNSTCAERQTEQDWEVLSLAAGALILGTGTGKESSWNGLPTLHYLSHLWNGWCHCQAMRWSLLVSKKARMS